MCSRATCRKCGKPTWSGCGNHIEIALKGVPKSQRCQGHANEPKEPGFFPVSLRRSNSCVAKQSVPLARKSLGLDVGNTLSLH